MGLGDREPWMDRRVYRCVFDKRPGRVVIELLFSIENREFNTVGEFCSKVEFRSGGCERPTGSRRLVWSLPKVWNCGGRGQIDAVNSVSRKRAKRPSKRKSEGAPNSSWAWQPSATGRLRRAGSTGLGICLRRAPTTTTIPASWCNRARTSQARIPLTISPCTSVRRKSRPWNR